MIWDNEDESIWKPENIPQYPEIEGHTKVIVRVPAAPV